jgi:hypothetical protein
MTGPSNRRSRETDAYAAALNAEHMAIFAYGVAGGRLDATDKEPARQAESKHRDRRDALIIRLSTASTPSPAEPAYETPFPVTDRPSALRLLIAAEDATARAWRGVLGEANGEERRLALDALVAAAVQATVWRRLAGVTPATLAFPGSPE